MKQTVAAAMSDWFSALAAGSELSAGAATELNERGFVVIPGPVPSDWIELLVDAYTAAVGSATGEDIKLPVSRCGRRSGVAPHRERPRCRRAVLR